MYDKGFRLAAIKLYNYIGNMKKTAKALGIGIATIWSRALHSSFARWIHNGIESTKKHKTSIPETLLSFIKCQIEKSNHTTQNELLRLIKEHLRLNVSRKCVSCALHILNFTRKRLRNRGFINLEK